MKAQASFSRWVHIPGDWQRTTLKTCSRRFLATSTPYPTLFLHSLWFPAARPMLLLFAPSFLFCQLEPELRPKAGVTWPRANGQGSASAYFPIVQNVPRAAQTGTIQAMSGTFSWKTEERKGPFSRLFKKIQVEELKGS